MIQNNLHLLTTEFHEKLTTLTIAVIGLGGTGSVVCQALSHLGVKNIILIDDDIMDELNQRKLVGGFHSDIDQTSKCDIMKRLINNITGNKCNITIEYTKFTRDNIELHNSLKKADFIFECVDNISGIRNINTFCVENKIPFIGCGVGMIKKDNIITKLGGQVLFVKPGDPCFECYTIKNGSKYHDRCIPYIQINSIIANLSIMEFVKYISKFNKNYYLICYDALEQKIIGLDKDESLVRCNTCAKIYD